MDNLIYILFICMALPLLLTSFMLENKARLIVIFLVIGSFMCMFVSNINGLILEKTGLTSLKITTTYTPITEEIIKAFPVLVYAFLISDKRNDLITISLATGIGFAILENAYILTCNIDNISYLWALSRVFGASLMHGLCTAAIGFGISFVRKKKKLFYTGTFALMMTAMIYHGIFNALVQSKFKMAGLYLPVVTYAVIILLKKRQNLTKKHANLV